MVIYLNFFLNKKTGQKAFHLKLVGEIPWKTGRG